MIGRQYERSTLQVYDNCIIIERERNQYVCRYNVPHLHGADEFHLQISLHVHEALLYVHDGQYDFYEQSIYNSHLKPFSGHSH